MIARIVTVELDFPGLLPGLTIQTGPSLELQSFPVQQYPDWHSLLDSHLILLQRLTLTKISFALLVSLNS